jgi:hypothetical protein
MKPSAATGNPQHKHPAQGPRSNPGNPEAGIGHTRGQNRPASVQRGRHGANSRPNDVHRVPPKR